MVYLSIGEGGYCHGSTVNGQAVMVSLSSLAKPIKQKYIELENAQQKWRWTGGGNSGVMRVGRLWEAGEERAGDWIPKGVGAGRNRK